MLKPQDIVILLKILARDILPKDSGLELLSQNQLATHLCMSTSEVNAGIKRLVKSGLLGLSNPVPKSLDFSKRGILRPIKPLCEECLISGVKYFFPGELGEYTRGIKTSYAAPAFQNQILLGKDPVPVWPYLEGEILGLTLTPLYTSVPKSVTHYPDPLFYDLLVLIDAIRSGRARERNIGVKLLREILNHE